MKLSPSIGVISLALGVIPQEGRSWRKIGGPGQNSYQIGEDHKPPRGECFSPQATIRKKKGSASGCQDLFRNASGKVLNAEGTASGLPRSGF